MRRYQKGFQILNSKLRKLISILAENVESLDAAAPLTRELAEELGLAKISYRLRLSSGEYPGEEMDHFNVLFHSGARENPELVYEKSERSDQDQFRIRFHAVFGKKMYTAEEKEVFDILAAVFTFYISRFYKDFLVKKYETSDGLTGLPDAIGIVNIIVSKYRNHTLTRYNAYYFNLVSFALLNRRYGYQAVNQLIITYAGILKDFTVGGECVGRLGGDNFVALIRKERTKDFLNLLSGVYAETEYEGRHCGAWIRAVAGVLEIDENLTDPSMVISFCAMALTRARTVDHKPYVFVTEGLIQEVYHRHQTAEMFNSAIQNQEFLPYYQPKVDSKRGKLVGAEALVRWIHYGEMILPSEFIPVVEQSDDVCVLDFYIFRKVCEDIRRWLDHGIEPVKVSVNFSRKNLSDPKMAERIVSVLRNYNVDPQYIEVEITETVNEKEHQLLRQFALEMKRERISIAIDDFGSGYSSLNELRMFPVDTLKIDKAFLDGGLRNRADRIILENVCRMASQLGMSVVVEGVEHPEQLKFLQSIGYFVIQGDLFSQPLSEEEFKKHLLNPEFSLKKDAAME